MVAGRGVQGTEKIGIKGSFHVGRVGFVRIKGMSCDGKKYVSFLILYLLIIKNERRMILDIPYLPTSKK